MRINHHVHLGHDYNRTGFKFSSKELDYEMKISEVDKAVIMCCPNVYPKSNPYYDDNQIILNESLKNNKFVPFMFVHPYLDSVEAVEKNHEKFSGFKIYSHAKGMKYVYDNLIESEVFRFILRTNKPVLVHTGVQEGEHAGSFFEIIETYSDTKFIFAHANRLYDKELSNISKLNNVYLDICPLETLLSNPSLFLADKMQLNESVLNFNVEEVINYLAKLFGNRLVWGSDSPWCNNFSNKSYFGEVNILKILENKGVSGSFLK